MFQLYLLLDNKKPEGEDKGSLVIYCGPLPAPYQPASCSLIKQQSSGDNRYRRDKSISVVQTDVFVTEAKEPNCEERENKVKL